MSSNELYERFAALVDYYYDQIEENNGEPLAMMDLNWYMYTMFKELMTEFRRSMLK